MNNIDSIRLQVLCEWASLLSPQQVRGVHVNTL